MSSRSPVQPIPDPEKKPAPAAARRPVVAVFGAAFLDEESPAYRTAFDLGGEIARRGWSVASGGYGGTMEAVSRGAAEAGGHTIGVTCDTLSRIDRRTNRWIKEEIRCPTARERLLTLARMGDAAVALDGGIGTLSEIAFCAAQIQTGELSPRPLILIGSVCWKTFKSFFEGGADYLKESDKALFSFASSAEESVRIILAHLERRTG